jgi:hypothetical protein
MFFLCICGYCIFLAGMAIIEESVIAELKRFENGIELLHQAVKGPSNEQAQSYPVPGKWSMLECVCHMADFEPIIAHRIKLMLAFENPELVGIDETAYGRALHYGKRNIAEELDLFCNTRRQLHRILSCCQPQDLARTGLHSELGRISVWTYLKAMSGHLEHHMKPMNEKRIALGLAAVPCQPSRDYPARGE